MSITSLPSGDFSRCWRSERASSARASIWVSERIRMPAMARCTSSERARGNRRGDLLQALRIGQALPRQRLERAHLRAGGRSCARCPTPPRAPRSRRPAAGDAGRPAPSPRRRRVGWSVRARSARVPRRSPRHASTQRAPRCQAAPARRPATGARAPAVARRVRRAHEIDLVLADAVARHAARQHAHEFGLLLRRATANPARAPTPIMRACTAASSASRANSRNRSRVPRSASIAVERRRHVGPGRCAGPIDAA